MILNMLIFTDVIGECALFYPQVYHGYMSCDVRHPLWDHAIRADKLVGYDELLEWVKKYNHK
jgi:hypothetical protein